jgi:hypothetical protein
MASGVAAISRFITPKPSAPAATATMKAGWRAISDSGRPLPAPGLGATCSGKRMNDSASSARPATPISAM